jgi:hypothetical protein
MAVDRSVLHATLLAVVLAARLLMLADHGENMNIGHHLILYLLIK